MNLNLQNLESTAARRAIIVAMIIPLTFLTIVRCPYYGVKNLWASAARQWRSR